MHENFSKAGLGPAFDHRFWSNPLQVLVRDNNIEQALKALKRKMQREGIIREMKMRRSFEKPSEKRVREAAEAVRRARKLARKQAQREGLLPAPKPRVRDGARPGAPGARPAAGGFRGPGAPTGQDTPR